MSSIQRPSLRTISLFSCAFVLTVIAGWVLLALAILSAFSTPVHAAGPPLAMTAALLVLLELLPLVQGRGHDPQGVVMSSAFVCAILFLWGIWPAVFFVSVAALASDLSQRKAPWKVFFNVGQYNLSVAAAWLVMVVAGHPSSLEHPLPRVDGGALGWMATAWVAYFVTNDVLVSAATAWASSFREVLFDDFWHYTVMTFAVLALSPLVVLLAQSAWVLLPLLLIPLLLVYRTAQMSLEQEHQAGHDSLTGLPNRINLQQSLAEELTRSRRESTPFGLLLIDLDHFKEINDTLGHQVGDQILVQFADRLSGAAGPEDRVCRLGGDEFAVIAASSDLVATRGLADRIRQSLVDPITLDGMIFDIEASIGIAMYPEQGWLADDLLRLADVAMYDAKHTRSGIATYAASRDRNSADRLQLLGQLRQALDDDLLTLHYQPKVSMRDQSLLGVEAMIRWEHPERGFVPPDEFIPLAERSGIMPQLTERVIALAMRQVADWRALGLRVQVAVNVSVTDLAGGRLAGQLADGLREFGLPAGALQLEITERIVAEAPEELTAVFAELAAMGITLSLDDFGTGYSSLLRLQSLPVDEIKIDRAFVSRLTGDHPEPSIVRAVIELAHALGVPAIAEGVENEQEWAALCALGCDGGQGWYLAPPMSGSEATDWIVTHQDSAPPAPPKLIAL
jgi:diguanylate cyclase (GGDEF)-like protein